MLRLLTRLAGVLVSGALLVSSSAAQEGAPVPGLPGVSYEHDVELTPHGPVSYTVITLPPPGGPALASFGPVLTGGTVTSPPERLTQLEAELSATSTAIGVNGDFFSARDNHPTGIVVEDGTLLHSPTPARTSVGIDAGGALLAARIAFAGTWRGSGQRHPLAVVNQKPGTNQTVLFTPAWGASTPAVPGGTAVVLEPFPAAEANADLVSSVSGTSDASSPVAIPGDGAVLVAAGSGAATLTAETSVGDPVTTRLILPTGWAHVTAAAGGGPLLVRNHRAVFHTAENFDAGELTTRDARAAVGQLADGRILLVAVDGGQPGYSVGMTTYELAQTMVRLGATTAVALQYGRPVTAALDGALLNRPAAGERPIKEALLYRYEGVYTPPPSAAVVGKAGSAQGEQLAYKLVRPSSVTAVLLGPNGVPHPLDSGDKPAGTYRFTWTAFDAEGTWRWSVQATDDLGRSSTAEETFTYDLTLSGLSVPRSASAQAGLAVGFALSRGASVSLQIETPAGTVVSTQPPVDLQAGPQSLTWPGTTTGGTPAPPGSYVARVTATSSIGTSDLSAPFTLHA